MAVRQIELWVAPPGNEKPHRTLRTGRKLHPFTFPRIRFPHAYIYVLPIRCYCEYICLFFLNIMTPVFHHSAFASERSLEYLMPFLLFHLKCQVDLREAKALKCSSDISQNVITFGKIKLWLKERLSSWLWICILPHGSHIWLRYYKLSKTVSRHSLFLLSYLSPCSICSLETSPITDTDLAKRTVFQRSYSVVASEYDKQHSILPARVKAIPRRRVNSGDTGKYKDEEEDWVILMILFVDFLNLIFEGRGMD